MKQKISLILFFALVSVKVSQQHGTKDGTISGTFTSSSSASHSSSSSSSSSSSFTATGSFNELGSGFKDIAASLGHGNSGSHFGSFGASNGGSLSGSSSGSGSFSSAGSGIGLTGVKGNQGIVGSGSTSGGFGGSFSGVACGLGKKDCNGGGDSNSKNGNFNGFGSQTSSFTGSSEKLPTGIANVATSDISTSKGTHNSGLDDGETPEDSGSYKPNRFTSSVSQPVDIVKEKPVTEKYGGFANPWSASTNSIPESSGSQGNSGSYAGSAVATGSSSQTEGFSKTPAEGNYGSNLGLSSSYPSGPGQVSGYGFPVGVQTTPTHPSGQENAPSSSFPTGSQPTVPTNPSGSGSPSDFPAGTSPGHSYYPSGQEHQHPPPGTISHRPTGSQSGSLNYVNNFGVQSGGNGNFNETPKKPCCTGPFPGPAGSIHTSKPAHLVPPIPRPDGSFSSSGTQTGGVSFTGSGTTGLVTGGGGVTQGSKGPCCKGPFPGPNGSIHDSKPAHLVPSKPSSPPTSHPLFPSYPSSGSHLTGSNNGYGPSNAFGNNPGSSEHNRPPCCKKPSFPGPNGSIHESKPATLATPVGSPEIKYTGPFPGPSGSILTSTSVAGADTSSVSSSNTQYQKVHGGVKHSFSNHGPEAYLHHVAKLSIALSPPVVGAPVAIIQYPSKLTTIIDTNRPTEVPSSGYATGTFSIQQPDDTYPQEKPGSGSLIYGSIDSHSGNTNENGFATGSVLIQKPDGSVTGGKDSSSSTSASESPTGGEGGSSITTASVSGTAPFGSTASEKPIVISRPTGQYSSNTDFVGRPATVVGNNKPSSAYAVGIVQKIDDIQSNDKPTSNSFLYGSTNSENKNNDDESGFATGSVVIQKPHGSVATENNVPSTPSAGPTNNAYSGSSSVSSGSYNSENGNGQTTLNVIVQKPDGSISGNKYLLGGSYPGDGSNVQITQFTSGSPSSDGSGSLNSNNGYAVGSVLIQKPDGSVTTGKDSPSSVGTSGIYSSGVKGGFGHKGIAGSYTFGSSGSGAFGTSPESGFFASPDNGAFGTRHGGSAVKESNGFGSYAGSHAGAGASGVAIAGPVAFGGAQSGSYAGAHSGVDAGFTGLLKGLFGKHGLGGNLGVAGAASGSFSKSHSYASSSSFAGSSGGSYSGHF